MVENVGTIFPSYGGGATLAQKVRAFVWRVVGLIPHLDTKQIQKYCLGWWARIMEGALTAILQSQEVLQATVTELCAGTWRTEARRAPRDVLTKLTMEDIVEAFLEVFEPAAMGEKWS